MKSYICYICINAAINSTNGKLKMQLLRKDSKYSKNSKYLEYCKI